jgi:hypothetical protein
VERRGATDGTVHSVPSRRWATGEVLLEPERGTGPLVGRHRVAGRVPDRPVACGPIRPEHTVEGAAYPADGRLGPLVAGIGLEADRPDTPPGEGLVEHQQLGLGVDRRALDSGSEPGVADAHPVEPAVTGWQLCSGSDGRPVPSFELVEAGAADHPVEGGGPGGERDLVPVLGMDEGRGDVGGHGRSIGGHPGVPERAAVGIRRVQQVLDMLIPGARGGRGRPRGRMARTSPRLAEPLGSVARLRPPVVSGPHVPFQWRPQLVTPTPPHRHPHQHKEVPRVPPGPRRS